MKKFVQLALITLVGAGGIVASSAPASAFIACNREGDCWHVQDRVRYPRAAGITIHPDNWHWGKRSHFRFNEHDGHGYWRGGVWITL
jgi:hypothetical protein